MFTKSKNYFFDFIIADENLSPSLKGTFLILDLNNFATFNIE